LSQENGDDGLTELRRGPLEFPTEDKEGSGCKQGEFRTGPKVNREVDGNW